MTQEFRWTWRSLAAIVYLAICAFDLVFMPLYREYAYQKLTPSEMVTLSGQIQDPAARVQTLQILKEDRAWVPLTSEMFHLSFGAILGVSAMRGGAGLPFRRRRRLDEEATPEENPEAEGGDEPNIQGRFE